MAPVFGSTRSTLIGIAVVTAVAVWALRDVVLLVGFAVLLAYALLPAVQAIERLRGPRGLRLPRAVVAGGVVLVMVTIVVWAVVLAVPRLVAEASHFAASAPGVLSRLVGGLQGYAAARGLSVWLDPAIEGVRADVPGMVQELGSTIAQGIGRLFGGIGNVLGLALLPLLAFYLLAESEAVQASALRLVPEEARGEMSRLGGVVDRALRSYVRGQAIVCLVTGAAMAVALALLHHPAALLLGLLVGIAELMPYIGFTVAAVAIGLAGSTVGMSQALVGIAGYAAINWAIGTFITPRLMGRYLRMHPFVVTVSVLAGAQLLGPAGALLALPAAAVLQVFIGELGSAPSRGGGRADGAAIPSGPDVA